MNCSRLLSKSHLIARNTSSSTTTTAAAALRTFALALARTSTRTISTTKPLFKPTDPMEWVRNTIAENFGGPAEKLAAAENQFKLEETPDLSGKVAVVTGGSEGIGYGFVHTLLKHNISKIFILSVSKEVVEGAKKSITEDLGAEAADKTEWIQCDLSDLPKVKDIAEHIKKSTDRIDILMNNAARGIMTYELTDYGVDRHMAVNHIGHAVLTSHLLPTLKSTSEKHGTVRIVFQASNAHQGAPSDVKFASLDEINQDLGPNGLYGRSKLAVLLYARYLARHLAASHPKILANATHPGFVSTKQSKVDIHEPYPILGYGMSVLFEPFKKDQFQGCVPAVFAATTTQGSGQYICPPAVVEEGTKMSQDEALGEQLMKLTAEIVAEKTQAKQQGCPLKFY